MSSQCKAWRVQQGGVGPAVLEFFPGSWGSLVSPQPPLIREYLCFQLSSNPPIKSSFTMREGHVVITAAPRGGPRQH